MPATWRRGIAWCLSRSSSPAPLSFTASLLIPIGGASIAFKGFLRVDGRSYRSSFR